MLISACGICMLILAMAWHGMAWHGMAWCFIQTASLPSALGHEAILRANYNDNYNDTSKRITATE